MTDKTEHSKVNRTNTRKVTADSNNRAISGGRTRVKDTLDLDFDYDFRKPGKKSGSGSTQYGLHPERNTRYDPPADSSQAETKSVKKTDSKTQAQKKTLTQTQAQKKTLTQTQTQKKTQTQTQAQKKTQTQKKVSAKNTQTAKTQNVKKPSDDKPSAKKAPAKKSPAKKKTVVKKGAKALSSSSAAKSGKNSQAKAKTKPAAKSGRPAAKPPQGKKVSAKSSKGKNASSKQGAKKSPSVIRGTGSAIGIAKAPAVNAKGKKTKKKKKPAKKHSKFFRFTRALIITFISLCILGGIAGGAYTAYVINNAPPIHPDRIYDTLAVTSHIYDDKGKLVDDIYYNENREITSYEQLPDNLKNAFIAIEDKTFWTHKGFNFRRIIGAILERFKGGRISGTSTITQQLARNVFLPEDKSVRSIKRKITEMYYAYQIEEELSKEEILTAYLNTIYLGYGCYGVDTAAKIYFNRSVEDLTLEQCAALAALPQAPGSYALLVTEKGDHTTKIKKHLYANDTSEARRNLVLQLMEEQGYITADEHQAAVKPLSDFIEPGSTAGVASTSAFKDYLIGVVKQDLMKEYGLTDEQATKMIYTKGLHIYSTMDSQAQKIITKEFKDKDNFPSTVKKDVTPEAAMVITEVGTGKVKAMVGTRNADGQMLFNRATNPRQPGSSIKPLTVYAAALQKSYEYQKKGQIFKYTTSEYSDRQGANGWGSYITVSSTVVDEPMKINGKTWPHNVTNSYSGTNTFRTAIQKSINTCAVKILAQVSISYSMDMLKKFGITTAVDDTSMAYNDMNYAALGLGAMTEGVTPLEMSLAYAAFPNGGVRNTPICYTKVEDSSGRVILESKSKEVRVMNEGVAWIMTNVLQSNVTQGIGYPAAVDGIRVGGKTGTTDSRYDIWFDGFTPRYSVALWIGTDNNVKMDSYSDKAAALWGKIVGQVKRAKKGEYRGMPKNVFRAWNGEYYTTGTAPPEPPPEPEEDEEAEDEDGKDKGKTDGKADPKINTKPDSKSKTDSKKSDKKD